jgi:hypothetical protein
LQAFSVVEGCMGGVTESMVSEEVAGLQCGRGLHGWGDIIHGE